ncbi:MAG: hypothetical protein KJO48_05695, partial [Ignavibacteria bacterium]|nr:hypothetical protein [Ignavibacteria bacterium]
FPDDKSVKEFIQKVIDEKQDNFENNIEAFLRYQRLNEYKKMLKAAVKINDNEKRNLELAAKCALLNNDMNYAWNAALYVKMV